MFFYSSVNRAQFTFVYWFVLCDADNFTCFALQIVYHYRLFMKFHRTQKKTNERQKHRISNVFCYSTVTCTRTWKNRREQNTRNKTKNKLTMFCLHFSCFWSYLELWNSPGSIMFKFRCLYVLPKFQPKKKTEMNQNGLIYNRNNNKKKTESKWYRVSLITSHFSSDI